MVDAALLSYFSGVATNHIEISSCGNYFEYDPLWEHFLSQDNNVAEINDIKKSNCEYSEVSGFNNAEIANRYNNKINGSEERLPPYQDSLMNNDRENYFNTDNSLPLDYNNRLKTNAAEMEVTEQDYSESGDAVTLDQNSLTDNTTKECVTPNYLKSDDSANKMQTNNNYSLASDYMLLQTNEMDDKQNDLELRNSSTSRVNLLTDSADVESKNNAGEGIKINYFNSDNTVNFDRHSQNLNVEREEVDHNMSLKNENLIHDSSDDGELLIDEVQFEENTVNQADLNDQELVESNQTNNCDKGSLLFEIKGVAEEDLFICDICHHVFYNEYKREIHHLKKHCESTRSGRESSNLETHKASQPPDIQLLARWIDGKKVFFCCVCSYRTKRHDAMFRHVTQLHDNGRYYDPPIYLCEVCGKTFKDKNYFRVHAKNHSADRFYICEVCGKSYNSRHSMVRHKECHLDDKKIWCKLCDFKTNRRQLMYIHADLHRSGAGLRCRVCGEMFFTRFALRRHLYTHSGDPSARSFPCSVCQVGFSSKSKSLNHERENHNLNVDQ